MKNWIYILSAVMFLASLPETSWSIENTAIRNPAGVSNVPPSILRNGLYRSPNPIDRSGNLGITGNVRRGRHFQALVPYRSTTAFGAILGSTSLDSFLRDSAGPEDFGSNKYMAQPYYSPTGTVATVRPGSSGVFKPETTKVSGQVPDTFGLEALSKKQVSSRQDTGTTSAMKGIWEPTSASRSRLWSTPLTLEGQPKRERTYLGVIEGAELSVPSETSVHPGSEKLGAEQYQRQMEQLQRDMMKIKSQASQLKTDTMSKEDLLKLVSEPGTSEISRKYDMERLQSPKALQPFERPRRPGTQTQVQKSKTPKAEITSPDDKFDKELLEALRATQGQEQLGMTPDTKKEFSGLPAADSRLRQEDTGTAAEASAKKRVWEPTQLSTPQYLKTDTDIYEGTEGTNREAAYYKLLRKLGGEASSTLEATNGGYVGTGQTQDSAFGGPGTTTSVVDEIKALSSDELSARAKRIMGPHKNLESFSQARFQRHMTTAQTYLKQGKYYQASDAFALALLYDSKNPAAYGGKSIALFAAGEYISSALFLSRALNVSEQYARSNINLTAILGDKDKIDKRIADAEEWLERSNVPELEFLLGYVYYQMGRLGPAQQAIDAAQKSKPTSPAVKALQQTIADAIRSSKSK